MIDNFSSKKNSRTEINESNKLLEIFKHSEIDKNTYLLEDFI